MEMTHPSAEDHREDIETYLAKEIKHKTIVGPFDVLPSDIHLSSMITPMDSVIVNFSHPYSDSVNDHINDTIHNEVEFNLEYPSADGILDAIRSLNSSALPSKH